MIRKIIIGVKIEDGFEENELEEEEIVGKWKRKKGKIIRYEEWGEKKLWGKVMKGE